MDISQDAVDSLPVHWFPPVILQPVQKFVGTARVCEPEASTLDFA